MDKMKAFKYKKLEDNNQVNLNSNGTNTQSNGSIKKKYYFDVRNLYWYEVTEADESPKMSIVYKRGTGEGVEYIDISTLKSVYPKNIIKLIYNDIVKEGNTTYCSWYFNDIQIPRSRFSKNEKDVSLELSFWVGCRYTDMTKNFDEEKFKTLIVPLSENTYVLECRGIKSDSLAYKYHSNDRVAIEKLPKYYNTSTIISKTQNSDNNIGIAMSNEILMLFIEQLNEEIIYRQEFILNSIKEAIERQEQKRREEEAHRQYVQNIKDNLFR